MLEPASSLASFASLFSSMAGFWWLHSKTSQRAPGGGVGVVDMGREGGGGGVLSPYQWCYRVMFGVNCFTWTSSTLFHIRPDLVILERMDYYGAFVSVFIPLFWFVCRNFYVNNRYIITPVLLFIAVTFICYVLYMELVKFDYALHMIICSIIGGFGTLVWVTWSIFNLKRLNHSRYYFITFAGLAGGHLIGQIFEEIPPYFWVIDGHSIFHIATSPFFFLFWWTIAVDDDYLITKLKQI